MGNFLLYSKIYTKFIDSTGRVFTYEKKTLVPLVYRKIRKYVPYRNGSMILFENVHCPIWFNRPVSPDEEYGALLLIAKGYLLLGLTKTASSKRTKFKI